MKEPVFPPFSYSLTSTIHSNHTMNRLSVFALAFAGANASFLNKRQGFSSDSPSDFAEYTSNVCMALDESGKSDMSLPCNQLVSIQYQCMGGSKLGDSWRNASSNDEEAEDDDDPEETLPNEAQRVCICQSQHNDLMKGCADCHKVHGGIAPEDSLTDSQIHAVMDKYCDASTPANDSYANVVYQLAYMGPGWDEISSPDSDSTTYSDPIGSATDVSLYFTASVTGSAAYIPGLPTGSVSDMTYTSSSTSDGLIVPTAIGSEKEESSSSEEESSSASASESASASASSSGGSETASSDGGAMQTAMAHPGALGALGLAAMIAAL
jgi:hypothetical protein